MVDQSSRGNGLSCSRWALNQRQWSRERFPDGTHLEVIELGKTLHRQVLWNRRIDVLILSVVAEELIEYVVGERGLVLQEDLERLLHSIEGR